MRNSLTRNELAWKFDELYMQTFYNEVYENGNRVSCDLDSVFINDADIHAKIIEYMSWVRTGVEVQTTLESIRGLTSKTIFAKQPDKSFVTHYGYEKNYKEMDSILDMLTS